MGSNAQWPKNHKAKSNMNGSDPVQEEEYWGWKTIAIIITEAPKRSSVHVQRLREGNIFSQTVICRMWTLLSVYKREAETTLLTLSFHLKAWLLHRVCVYSPAEQRHPAVQQAPILPSRNTYHSYQQFAIIIPSNKRLSLPCYPQEIDSPNKVQV